MSNIEQISATVIESLQEEQSTPERKQEVTAKITDALAVLREETEMAAFRDRFQLDLQSLRVEEREQINQNLKTLELPQEVGSLLLELIELKKEVENNEAPTSMFSTFGETVGDNLEDVTEAVLPKEWTDTMSRGQKIATAVAGTGLLMASIALVSRGVAALYDWMNRTVESAKRTAGTVVKYALIAAVPVAVLFGPQIYNWTRRKIGEVAQNEIADAIQQKTADVHQSVHDVVAGVLPAQQDPVLQENVGSTDEDVQESDAQQEIERPAYQPPAEIEAALRAADTASTSMAAAGLLFMHRDLAKQAGIDFANDEETKMVNAILQRPVVRSLPLHVLQEAKSADDIVAHMNGAEFSSEEKHALLFLALVVQKQMQKTSTKQLLERAELADESVTLGEFLDVSGSGARLVARIAHAFDGKSLSDLSDLQEELNEAFASEDVIQEFTSNPILAKRLQELHPDFSDKKLAGAFAFYCLAPGQHGHSILRHIVDEPVLSETDAIFKEALQNIRTAILQPEALEHMLQYSKSDEHKEVFRRHFAENLSVADAIHLYIGLQTVRMDDAERQYPEETQDANAVGAFLLQMKLLQMMHNIDRDKGIQMRTWLLMDTAESIVGLPEMHIPPEAQEMIQAVAEAAGERGLSWLGETYDSLRSEICIPLYEMNADPVWKYPTVATETVAGTGLSWALWRFLKWRTTEWHDIMANRLGGIGWLNAIQQKLPPWWLRLTETSKSAWNPEKATHMAKTIRGVEDAIKCLDPRYQKAGNQALSRLHYRGTTPENMAKFYEEIDALRKAGADPAKIDDIVAKAHVMEQHAPAMLHRRFGFFRRQFWGATPWQRFAWGTAVVGQSVSVYQDVQDVADAYEQRSQMEHHVENIMSEMRERLDQDPNFVRVEDGLYRHKQSGVECELRIPDSVTNLLNGNINTEYAELATSSAALATTILMGAKTFSGPVGLIVVGVELVIRGGIAAWKEGNMREFIRTVPPWLLVQLGTQQTVQQSEYDVLDAASTTMLSDIFPSLDDSDKPEMRKKMLFTIFHHDLGRYAPELLQELVADKVDPLQSDEFYNGEFETIILPYYYTFLFEEVGDAFGAQAWREFTQGKIDTFWLPPTATFVQVRTAMRRAAIMYTQHVREQQYIDLRNYYEYQQSLFDEETDAALTDQIATLQKFVEEAGQQLVFGEPLSQLSDETVEENDWHTRAELLLDRVHSELEDTHGETYGEKIQSNPELFTVQSGDVPGLSAAVDLSDSSQVLSLLTNPVTRERIAQVFAETTDEPEGAVRTWSQWLELPTGVDEYHSVHMARMAAKNAAATVPDNASFDAAMHGITEGAISVFAQRADPPRFSRNTSLENELYGDLRHKPVVFSNLSYRFNVLDDYPKLMRLCQSASQPRTSQAEFAIENAQAVFVEGKVMPNGHKVVLLTFVYQDPENPNKKIIVQQGGATSATSSSQAEVAGSAVAADGFDLHMQQGGPAMLTMAEDAWRIRAQEIKEQEQQETEAEQHRVTERAEYERCWKEEIAPREFAAAVESAQDNPETYQMLGSRMYILFREEDSTFITYMCPSYETALSSGSGNSNPLQYGENLFQSSSKMNTIVVHKTKEAALQYYLDQKYEVADKWIRISGYALLQRKPDWKPFIESYMCKPLTHGRYDISRIVDLFPHTIDHPRFFGSTTFNKVDLEAAIVPQYTALETNEARELFLHDLFERLATEGTITSASNGRIIRWFATNKRRYSN